MEPKKNDFDFLNLKKKKKLYKEFDKFEEIELSMNIGKFNERNKF